MAPGAVRRTRTDETFVSQYLNGPIARRTEVRLRRSRQVSPPLSPSRAWNSVVFVFMQPALRQEWSWMFLHGPQCAFEMSMFKCVLQFTL